MIAADGNPKESWTVVRSMFGKTNQITNGSSGFIDNASGRFAQRTPFSLNSDSKEEIYSQTKQKNNI